MKVLVLFRLVINIECNNIKYGILIFYVSGLNVRGFFFVDLVGVGIILNFWGFTSSVRVIFFFCWWINWFFLWFVFIWSGLKFEVFELFFLEVILMRGFFMVFWVIFLTLMRDDVIGDVIFLKLFNVLLEWMWSVLEWCFGSDILLLRFKILFICFLRMLYDVVLFFGFIV